MLPSVDLECNCRTAGDALLAVTCLKIKRA
jgi:hypothetical protein